MFYFRLLNNGAIPAYRARVRIYNDDIGVYENIIPILDVGKFVDTMFIYTIKDGKEHKSVIEVSVLNSFHLGKKNRISGIYYRWSGNVLMMTFDFFKKYPTTNFYVLTKDGTLHQGISK